MADDWNHPTAVIERVELLREALAESVRDAHRVIRAANDVYARDSIHCSMSARKIEATNRAMSASATLMR